MKDSSPWTPLGSSVDPPLLGGQPGPGGSPVRNGIGGASISARRVSRGLGLYRAAGCSAAVGYRDASRPRLCPSWHQDPLDTSAWAYRGTASPARLRRIRHPDLPWMETGCLSSLEELPMSTWRLWARGDPSDSRQPTESIFLRVHARSPRRLLRSAGAPGSRGPGARLARLSLGGLAHRGRPLRRQRRRIAARPLLRASCAGPGW